MLFSKGSSWPKEPTSLESPTLAGRFFTTEPPQFSRSVVSDSLRPHESQHARPPCPSPTPGVHSNSCPSSRRCHPAISSSAVPFSSRPQSLPASGSLGSPKANEITVTKVYSTTTQGKGRGDLTLQLSVRRQPQGSLPQSAHQKATEPWGWMIFKFKK